MQPKSLFFVTNQLNLRIWHSVWRQAMLGAIEYEDSTLYRECGDNVWVLRLIPSLVDFAGMVNLLDDIKFDNWRRGSRSRRLVTVTANLTAFLIMVVGIRLGHLGNVNFDDLNIVWLPFSGVRSEQESVRPRILVLAILNVREPLCRQGRPLKRGALECKLRPYVLDP